MENEISRWQSYYLRVFCFWNREHSLDIFS